MPCLPNEGSWIRVEIARSLGQTNHDLIASKRTKLLPENRLKIQFLLLKFSILHCLTHGQHPVF